MSDGRGTLVPGMALARGECGPMSDSSVTVSYPAAERPGFGEFSRIVVGVDGSEESIDALSKARSLAEEFDAQLDVVCVWN